MISPLVRNVDLDKYKNYDDQFICGLKGIIRLSVGRQIIYRMGHSSIPNFFVTVPNIYKVECILAVTDKRIILIPNNVNHAPISLAYDDINITYYDQLFDKVFLLNIKNKKILNFCENKLVFRICSKQTKELNKIKCILQEYSCP
ncbi:hypothetical protein JMF89_02465 [Clostridiaceae bacterium UIB06]|uniref:Uncharacterized protein n=1 Tax=Clostridium thailandense TaxID=2794346 RepID=A0A949WQV1_9CLOT|nr:hypothetical protein [Clostridium thailandense]MBV7273216.1 hypothetical protein [Clostridium thailandense]MCH5136073.1 hypothetical protein [Clostridiaceae bacterium UIB06]